MGADGHHPTGVIAAGQHPGSGWHRLLHGLSLVPRTGFKLAAKLLIPRRRHLSLRDLEASRLTSARRSPSIWKIGFKKQESG